LWLDTGTSTKTGRHDIAEILLKVALGYKKSKSNLRFPFEFRNCSDGVVFYAFSSMHGSLKWRMEIVDLILIFLYFNATFNNISAISWRPVLVVEETGVSGENHQPWASNWS
jgi:hypothetical protein